MASDIINIVLDIGSLCLTIDLRIVPHKSVDREEEDCHKLVTDQLWSDNPAATPALGAAQV